MVVRQLLVYSKEHLRLRHRLSDTRPSTSVFVNVLPTMLDVFI